LRGVVGLLVEFGLLRDDVNDDGDGDGVGVLRLFKMHPLIHEMVRGELMMKMKMNTKCLIFEMNKQEVGNEHEIKNENEKKNVIGTEVLKSCCDVLKRLGREEEWVLKKRKLQMNMLSHVMTFVERMKVIEVLGEIEIDELMIGDVCHVWGVVCVSWLYEFKEANLLFEKKLMICEKIHGIDHVEVAMTLTNLGNTCESLGNFELSKQHLERALSINEKYFGIDHVEVAKTLTNLGITCGSLGNFELSKQHLERALSINEKYFGIDHFEVAKILTILGITCESLGNFELSKQYLERSLSINEKYFGIDHVSIANILTILGITCQSLGNFELSKQHLERAHSIHKKFNQINKK
jgi:hypothetical protein